MTPDDLINAVLTALGMSRGDLLHALLTAVALAPAISWLRPRVDPVLARWAAALTNAPTASEVVAWALMWLMAPAFQARFDELLKQDYPRLPPPESDSEWRAGVALGEALVHLCTRDDGARLPERSEVGHHREVRAPWGFQRAISAADGFVQGRFSRGRDDD